MGLVKKGKELWFYEDLYTDVTYGFKVKNVLVPEFETGFQRMMVLETDRFGKVLVLDGIVQLTEEDEGIYHEWIGHWPVFALNRPARNVLVIGGGDGGVAREVLRHKSVRKVTMVEIDRHVIDLCRKHMPEISGGIWTDPRFQLIVGDGAKVIQAMKGQCDVVMIDSTDPIGPAKSLFNTSFYQSVYDALRDGGITIHQTGALILQPFEAPGSWRQIERTFDDVRVVQFTNVSYMGGPFSLTAGSKGKNVFPRAERNARRAFAKAGIRTSWYTPEISAVPYPEFQRRLETDKYGEEVVIDAQLPGTKSPDVKQVSKWSRTTCEAIDMVAYGEPMVSSRAMGEGDTLVQYIETSAINYRRYGRVAALNCFTCAKLPTEAAIAHSLKFFGAKSGTCWHMPRGSFSEVTDIRDNTRIFRAEPASGGGMKITSPVFRPRVVDMSDVFRRDFRSCIARGTAPAYELIIDLFDCDYGRISSCPAVEEWARRWCRLAGVSPIGKAHAPDFGHAKKKTAGPSVTQLFQQGSNISHYSANWLMFVVNIVSRKDLPLEKLIRFTQKYFKVSYGVCWLIPRGAEGSDVQSLAGETLLFPIV